MQRSTVYLTINSIAITCALIAAGGVASAQPAQRTLFVSNVLSDGISVFAVENDGTLTEIAGSPFAAGLYGRALALSHDGRYLAIAHTNQAPAEEMRLFSVGETGALTLLPGNPWFTGPGPVNLHFGPGGYLYSPCGNEPQLNVFTLAGDALAELPASPYAFPSYPQSVDTTSDGRYVYVSQPFGNLLLGFETSPAGDLQALDGSPYQLPGEFGAFDVTVSPDDRHAYLGLGLGDAIAGVQIHADGSVADIPGSPFQSTIGSPAFLAINPAGTFVFVADVVEDGVATMSRDAQSGALSLLPDSFRHIGRDVGQIVADERFLFVTDQRETEAGMGVMAYAYDKSGLPTLVPGSPFAAEDLPHDMALFAPPATGDVDSNGVVDLADYADWPACFVGPAHCTVADCSHFDLDRDCDVDNRDFALLMQDFAGAP